MSASEFFHDTPQGDCLCGHAADAHDAGECWTTADNVEHPNPPCECGWYEPAIDSSVSRHPAGKGRNQ